MSELGEITDRNMDFLSFSPQKPAENVWKRSLKENKIGLFLKSNTTEIKLLETREKKYGSRVKVYIKEKRKKMCFKIKVNKLEKL